MLSRRITTADGIRMVAHDIQVGKVYEKNGVTVTAFLVSHGLVKPSYGYRVDYGGGRSRSRATRARPTTSLRFAGVWTS